MKIIWITITAVLFFALQGCEDKAGFLFTENAGYTPDSVEFKAELNPELPEDSRRIEFEIPWQSQGIQGVDGTPPIEYSISRVEPEVPEADLTQFTINRGSGVLELPYNHTLPTGRYRISLYVSNIRNKIELPSVLTIIIK